MDESQKQKTERLQARRKAVEGRFKSEFYENTEIIESKTADLRGSMEEDDELLCFQNDLDASKTLLEHITQNFQNKIKGVKEEGKVEISGDEVTFEEPDEEKEKQECLELITQFLSGTQEQSSLPLEFKSQVSQFLHDLRAQIRNKFGVISYLRDLVHQREQSFASLFDNQRKVIDQIKLLLRENDELNRSEKLKSIETLEKSFSYERNKLIENEMKTCHSAFDKKRRLELEFTDHKIKLNREREEELINCQERDEEVHSKHQRNFEGVLNKLDKILQNMKASFMLNAEKLEYNYRILSEREEENVKILSTQKRKLTKLKDSLSLNVKLFYEQDLKFKQRNMDLAEEYKRLTKQYRDLQEKFRHFERVDKSQYDDLEDLYIDEKNKSINLISKLTSELNEAIPILSCAVSIDPTTQKHIPSPSELTNLVDDTPTPSSESFSLESSFIYLQQKISQTLGFLNDNNLNSDKFMEALGLQDSTFEKQKLVQYFFANTDTQTLICSDNSILDRLKRYIADSKGIKINLARSRRASATESAQIVLPPSTEQESTNTYGIPFTDESLSYVIKSMKQYNTILDEIAQLWSETVSLEQTNTEFLDNISSKMNTEDIRGLIVPPVSSFLS